MAEAAVVPPPLSLVVVGECTWCGKLKPLTYISPNNRGWCLKCFTHLMKIDKVDEYAESYDSSSDSSDEE